MINNVNLAAKNAFINATKTITKEAERSYLPEGKIFSKNAMAAAEKRMSNAKIAANAPKTEAKYASPFAAIDYAKKEPAADFFAETKPIGIDYMA